MLKIGRFQLENLLAQKVPFLFILLDKVAEDHPEIEILARAHYCTAEDLFETVETAAQSKEYPLVLICESEKKSAEAANHLIGEGYINVYLIENGFAGLKS